MIFSIPVEFNLTAKRKGRERKQSGSAWQMVDFEIKEISDDEAPIVVKWRQDFIGIMINSDRTNRAIGPAPYDEPMHVRKLAETFLRPVMCNRANNGLSVSMPTDDAVFKTAESFANMLSDFRHPGLFPDLMPGSTNIARLRTGKDVFDDFEEVDRHDLEAQINSLQQRLSNYRIIDGIFYEECDEPVVPLFTSQIVVDQMNTVGVFALVTTNLDAFSTSSMYGWFHLEDYEKALTIAKKRNINPDTKRDIRFATEAMSPDKSLLESVYADDVLWKRHVCRRAAHIMNTLSGKKLSDISERVLPGYLLIAQALKEPEDEDRWERMTEGLSIIVSECKTSELNDLSVLAAEGIGILDDRPIGVNVTPNRYLPLKY